MKKVLFVATITRHINRFHLPYLELFKKKGWKTYVATGDNVPVDNFCDKKIVVPISRSPYRLHNLEAIKKLTKIIKKEHFDIIHCHTPMGGVVTRLAARKARKNGTRVIYTAHGFHFYKGAPLLNWLLFYPIEKYLAKYTDTLITINQEDFNRAKRKFSKRCHDIRYVPGVGIDPKKFDFKMSKKEKHELRKSLGLKDDDFVVIFPARLDKNKNQGFLIESMPELIKDNQKIHLLLPGQDELNGKYQRLAKKLGVENNVHFLGFRSDIPALLQISNLAVSASKREGLPVNLIEAAFAGLPIVASNCRGNCDVCLASQGAIIQQDDVEPLVRKIQTIAKRNQYKAPNKIESFLLQSTLKATETIYFKKKKILHVLASNKYSGAENVACTIIKNLSGEYDMAYCSPDGPIRSILEERNIQYFPLEKLNRNNLKKIVATYSPDIIHAHDLRASLGCLPKKNKTKFFVHVHNNDPEMAKFGIKSLLLLIVAKSANAVLTVSDSVEREYIFRKVIKNKISCVHNPLDKESIIKSIDDTIPSKHKEYDICCLARISPQKNPLLFVNIITEVKEIYKDVSCIWIGDGEARKDMERYIIEHNLENNITLAGNRRYPYPLVNKSKLFLMTSSWEGFGIAAYEALCLGLPCVVSNVGGLPYIVDKTCGKLCNNQSEYTSEILKLLGSDAEYIKKSKGALKKAESLNNIKEYMHSLRDIYEAKF